jgi:hypothetical protein
MNFRSSRLGLGLPVSECGRLVLRRGSEGWEPCPLAPLGLGSCTSAQGLLVLILQRCDKAQLEGTPQGVFSPSHGKHAKMLVHAQCPNNAISGKAT